MIFLNKLKNDDLYLYLKIKLKNINLQQNNKSVFIYI